MSFLLRRASAAIGLCMVIFAATADARAWCQLTTNIEEVPVGECPQGGQPLRWSRRCMSYAIDSRGASDIAVGRVKQVTQNSFNAWTTADCGSGKPDLTVAQQEEFSQCRTPQFNEIGGNVSSIIFVTDWAALPYDPTAFAITTVWHDPETGEIRDVDMEINEERGLWGECPVPQGCLDGTIDLANIMTHEVGHFFGLGHSMESDLATMNAVSSPGEVRKASLAQDDVDGICTVYPPDSGSGGCSFEPAGGLQTACVVGVVKSCASTSPVDLAGWVVMVLCWFAITRGASLRSGACDRWANPST